MSKAKNMAPAAAPAAVEPETNLPPVNEQAAPSSAESVEPAPTAVEAEAQAPAAPVAAALVKARVLAHCEHGKPDDVIELAPELAKSLEGVVDTDPAAVKYAESLK